MNRSSFSIRRKKRRWPTLDCVRKLYLGAANETQTVTQLPESTEISRWKILLLWVHPIVFPNDLHKLWNGEFCQVHLGEVSEYSLIVFVKNLFPSSLQAVILIKMFSHSSIRHMDPRINMYV